MPRNFYKIHQKLGEFKLANNRKFIVIFNKIYPTKNIMHKFSIIDILIIFMLLPLIFFFLNGFVDFFLNFDLKTIKLSIIPVFNSIFSCVGIGFLSLGIGLINSIVVTFFIPIKFHKLCDFLLISPVIIPSYLFAFIFEQIFEYQFSGIFNLHTTLGFITIFSLNVYPYLYILLRISLINIHSQILIAQNFNISNAKILYSIIIPGSFPQIINGLLFICCEVMSDFKVAHQLGFNNISVYLHKSWFYFQSQSVSRYASILSLIVSIFFIYLFVKYYQKSRSNYKSLYKINQNIIFNKKIYLIFFPILTSFCSFIVPIFTLLKWHFIKYSIFQLILDIYKLIPSIINTLSISFFVTIFNVLIVFFVIFYEINENLKKSKNNKQISLIGYAIPSILIILGMIFIFEKLKDYTGLQIAFTSIFTMFYVYLVKFIGISFVGLNFAFDRIRENFRFIISNSPKNIFLKLFDYFLLLKFDFLAITLILFIDITKESSISSIIRPFNFDTLAIKISNFIGDELQSELLAPVIIIALINLIVFFYLNQKINKAFD